MHKGEECICSYCSYHLPKTGFHLDDDNQLSRMFWGRTTLNSVAAFYYFNKSTKVQKLIHQLKYKGKKEIGIKTGELYGNELKASDLFKNIDIIIPVPLHFSKEKKRGYNQSRLFAEGIAKSLNKEVDFKMLFRNRPSETQTRKSRYSRWENVSEIFSLADDYLKLKGFHILLVDDVITTGATIEACANALFKIPEIKLSVAAMAYAYT
ncbi:MAG: ComF family protein [Bacteroidales bacterium]|nr:ComF family protein [Bacteroidales bacterium]